MRPAARFRFFSGRRDWLCQKSKRGYSFCKSWVNSGSRRTMAEAGGGRREAFGAAAQGDLREFLRQAEDEGELVRIAGADPNLELGALAELSHEHLYPPVLLFEDIKGYSPDFRILSNVR